MKYRIKEKSIVTRTSTNRSRGFRAKQKSEKHSATALPIPCPKLLPFAEDVTEHDSYNTLTAESTESIRIELLFEQGSLPSPTIKSKRKKERKKRYAYIHAKFKEATKKLSSSLDTARRDVRVFSGALCSVFLLCFMCVGIVLLTLFGKYLLPYDTVSIPQLEGKSIEDIRNTLGNNFDIVEAYESSPSAPVGTIISQDPPPNVTRRLYGSATFTIAVTVSSGRGYHTLEDLVGMSERDAVLKMKNAGISVNTVYEYSNDAEYGTITATSPLKGERIYDGETLTITLSLGKRTTAVRVPNLYTLSATDAEKLLISNGLMLGSITYVSSSQKAGRIISQQYAPQTEIKKGSSVDVTVSLGEAYVPKSVPDLTGLSVDEAKRKLAERGLILGNIYSVSSGAPLGTVVAQTPIPDAPISPSKLTVDIFISS